MKKLKHTSVLALLIMGIAFITIKEKSTTTEYYTTTTGLNVRTGIGSNYPISFTLDKEEVVVILVKNRGWYKIMYSGKTGFVNSKYIQKQTKIIPNQGIFQSQQKDCIALFILLAIIVGIMMLFSFKLYRHIRDKKLLETVTATNRGTVSEKDLVLKLLKYGISEQHIFHDLYVPKQDGSFSQIDLVVITEVGIIVFEVKDYAGWIYGTGNQSQWTKVLSYGKQKYVFQNPVIQNRNHIINLKRQLSKYGNLPYYSLIVFYGNSVLKNISYIPKGTFIVKSARVLEAVRTISTTNIIYDYTNIEDVIEVLNDAKTKGGISGNQSLHIENVNEILGKNRIFD